MLRAPVANALLQQGLVERLDDQPAWRRSQPLLEPALVERVTTAAGVSGLPAFNISLWLVSIARWCPGLRPALTS